MASAIAEPAPYPRDEVLAAFATACATAEDFAVARAGLLAGGWSSVAEDASNPLGKLVSLGRTATNAMKDVKELPGGGSFGKQVAGRQLYLALSGVKLEGMTSQACRMYDFAATEGLSAEVLEDWAVRKPSERKEPGQGVVKTTWNPGIKPGHMDMEIMFVPQDSPVGKALGVTGLSFATSVMEIDGL